MVREIENEMMFINAWVKEKFPNAKVWPRMRLGKPPNNDPFLKVTLGFVDKVIITDGAVLLIEGKIKPSTKAIGQLIGYKKLFPETPEFEPWKEAPIRLILLTPVNNPIVRELAADQGIEYVFYRPPEIEGLLARRFNVEEED